VDEKGKYRSLLHYNAFVKNNLQVVNPEREALFSTSVKLIAETLSAQAVLTFNYAEIFKCVVIVSAAGLDTFKKAVAEQTPEHLVVICADRPDVQKHCVDVGVRVIVLSAGAAMDKELREKAEKKGVTVLLTPYNSSEAAMIIPYSAVVSTMADAKIRPVNLNDTIRKVRPLLQESPGRALPVVNDAGKLVGIISESDLLQESNVELILVDHNELPQALEGAENYIIQEVIDHHRLGSFSTRYPISFINKPVGATCTLIAGLYRQNRVPIQKEIACILLSGILADTLMLQSATTTDEDRETAEYLSNVTGMDIQKLGQEIITAASNIGGKSAGEVIHQDIKEYGGSGSPLIWTVSQIEVNNSNDILSRKKEFLDELEIERRTRKALFAALMVTDIVRLTSLLFIAGRGDFLQSLALPKQDEGIYQLNDIVSRKKQLVPLLSEQVDNAGLK
jgi:manganese-dependent inorganic pyrophosphatase